MELERMGEVLAKAMGWTTKVIIEGVLPWYMYGGFPVMPVRGWTPQDDWSQCGMVIGAMQEKKWTLVVTYSPTGPWVKYHKTNDKNQYRWATSDDPADDLCAEICEVAARALESEVTDE